MTAPTVPARIEPEKATLPQDPIGQTSLADFKRRAQAAVDAAPETLNPLAEAANAADGASPSGSRLPPAPPSRRPGLFARLRNANREFEASANATIAAGARGVFDAANEVSDFAVGLGGFVAKVTRVNRLFGEQSQKDFLEWYDSGAFNPFKVSEEFLDKTFGKPKTGVDQFVNGVTRFVAVGGALKGLTGLKTAGSLGVVGLDRLKGAIADVTAFDPDEERLSNLINNADIPVIKAIADLPGVSHGLEFLETGISDSNLMKRAKAAMEGFLVGEALGGVIRTLARTRIKKIAKAGQITKEEAALRLENVEAAAKEAGVDDSLVEVVERPDGSALVVARKGEVADVASAQQVDAPTPQDIPVQNNGLEFTRLIRDRLDVGEGSSPEFITDGAGVPLIRARPEAISNARVDLSNIEILGESQETRGLLSSFLEEATQTADDLGTPLIIDPSRLATGGRSVAEVRDMLRRHGFVAADNLDNPRMTRKPGAVPETFRELKTLDAAEETGIEFSSVSEAHQFAGALNIAARRAEVPRGSLSVETINVIRSRKQEILDSKSAEDLQAVFQRWGTDMNFSHMSDPVETLAEIEAMAQVLPTVTEMARGRGTRPDELIIELAQQLYATTDPDEALAMAVRQFGSLEQADVLLLSTMARQASAARRVHEMSQLADQFPDNAVHNTELATALNNLWDWHIVTAGQKARVARTLRVASLDPARVLDEVPAVRDVSTPANAAAVEQEARDAISKAAGKTPEEPRARRPGAGVEPRRPQDSRVGESQADRVKRAQKVRETHSRTQTAIRRLQEEARKVADFEVDPKPRPDPAIPPKIAKDTPGTKTGDAPNATDFQLAKARKDALRIIRDAQDDPTIFPDGVLPPEVTEYLQARSQAIIDVAEEQKLRPETATPEQTAKAEAVRESRRVGVNPLETLAGLLTREDEAIADALARGKFDGSRRPVARPEPAIPDAKLPQELRDVNKPPPGPRKPRSNDPVRKLERLIEAEGRALDAIRRKLEQGDLQGQRTPGLGDDLIARKSPVDAILGRRKSPGGNKLTAGLTKVQLRALARQFRLAGDKWEDVLKAMQATNAEKAAKGNPTLLERVVRFRIGMMLTKPITLATNFAGNMMEAMAIPTEMILGGMPIPGRRKLRPELMSNGVDMFSGYLKTAGDSFRMARKAFELGENALDRAGTSIFDDANSSQAVLEGTSWLARLADVTRRTLIGTDEFFQNLVYRSRVYADGLQDGRALGLTGQKLAEHAESTLEAATSLGSQAPLNPSALELSRKATFKNQLLEGTVGASVLKFSQDHPASKLLGLTFVRTPTNLFIRSWERTPFLNRFTKEYQEALQEGGERFAIMQAKTELGMMIYGTAAVLALSGNVTGGGPSNPTLRKQAIAAGFKPWSIRVPGTRQWVSYRRGDPLLTGVGVTATAVETAKEASRLVGQRVRVNQILEGENPEQARKGTFGDYLGLIADFVHASGEIAEEDGTDMIAAFAAGVASSITSKTFYQDAVRAMDAVSSGEQNALTNFGTNLATSFIPNILSTAFPEEAFRETNGLLDELLNKTPFRGTLEPQRNAFGQPILRPPGFINNTLNPFTISKMPDDDDALMELVRLGRAMSLPSPIRGNGLVNLRDRDRWWSKETPEEFRDRSPQDVMMSLLDTPLLGGQTLEQAMTKLQKTALWKNASSGTASDPGGLRYTLAQNLMHTYYELAERKMLRSYPKLERVMLATGLIRDMSSIQGEAGEAAARRLLLPPE